MYSGRFSDAVRFFDVGAARDLGEKNPDRAAIKFASAAFAHLAAGRNRQAIAAADAALTHGKSMPVRFLAGRAYAEAGAVAKANALATPLAREFAAEPQAHGKILQGQIALAGGNPREAIRILTEANGILNTWFGQFDLGRAFLAAGQLQQAESAFDSTIARRGEALSLMDEGPTFGHFPAAYYYQAKVREALGRSSAAVEAYRLYLDARGDSSEDPLLAEIRRKAAQ
jgi:tetratricopeptide (TPR) repeat protein